MQAPGYAGHSKLTNTIHIFQIIFQNQVAGEFHSKRNFENMEAHQLDLLDRQIVYYLF